MRLSLFLSGGMLILYSFVRDYNVLLLLTFVWAIVNEAFRPANLHFICEAVPAEQHRTAFALNRLAINIGMSIGPVAGGFLSMVDYSILFYVDAATSLGAGVFLLVSKWAVFPGSSEKHQTDKENLRDRGESIYKDYFFLYFLLASIPAQLVFFQHIGAMPLYIVNNLGYSPAVFGTLSAINTVIIIFLEVPLNNALSGWTFRKTLAAGALLCGLGFGSMAYSATIPLLAVSIILFTFGEMIYFPVTAAYVSNTAPKQKMGEYMGYLQMTFSLSFLLGPWLGTVILGNYGSVILWTGALFFGFFSALMMLRLRK
jgi:MFS family permease